MVRALSIACVSLVGFSVVGASGCKVSACPNTVAMDGGRQVANEDCFQFESTAEYNGGARTTSRLWSSGKNVTIDNQNGALAVDAELVSNVEVSGVPFTRDGIRADERQHATDHLSAMPPPRATLDAAGNIFISAPGGGFDGYRLTVHLPLVFDGVLSATNINGTITYFGTPISTGNKIDAINGAVVAAIGASANATVTAATVLGKVTFSGPWTDPVVSADLKSGHAEVGDGSGSLEIKSGNGDIELDLK